MISTQEQTLSTIKRETNYQSKYNLYSMAIEYDYDIDDIISNFTDQRSEYLSGKKTIEAAADLAGKTALDLDTSTHTKFQPFGCSAFTSLASDGTWRMGRNYDFKLNSSGMLVYCHPKNRYRSIAFAALANVGVSDPLLQKDEESLLLTPFVCLDGINEKGVSVAVLVVDGMPTCQNNKEKPDMFTSLAIRLVLDKASSTDEAIKMLEGYNMFAAGGKDYHFYISDAHGVSKVVEYDFRKTETRDFLATSTNIATNFYLFDGSKYYGHGHNRYVAIQRTLDFAEKNPTEDVLWDALKNSSQEPIEGDLTSNTQWSILFDNSANTAEIVFRRNWDDSHKFALTNNGLARCNL